MKSSRTQLFARLSDLEYQDPGRAVSPEKLAIMIDMRAVPTISQKRLENHGKTA